MWCARLLMFFLVVGGLWRHVRCTCVLESEFGFTLNCAFKKSGLFRVRNLGGIKAHVGLGFTVGDELGFPESLSNVEFNRRRSTQTNGLQNVILAESIKNQNNQINGKVNNNVAHQPQKFQRTQSQEHLPKPTQTGKLQMPLAMAVVPVRPTNKLPSMNISAFIPPFKPIPPALERPTTEKIISSMDRVPSPAVSGIVVPTFQAMPSSISRVSAGNTIIVSKPPTSSAMSAQAIEKTEQKKKLNSNNLALRTLPTATSNTANALPQISLNTIKALAVNSNISMEAIEAAIQQKQQQLMKQQQQQQIIVTTTKRPATFPPKRHHNTVTSTSKVMNAPKEYYPVGYDKNFDDNFSSRVELPETSFHCGDQKHFPGLYADDDLGCMVFHVCALTDDGLIMKSFLCPESTLFDQTILKCNWWFYVDCKNSKKLYDSNIPISKSYQLMKALTFFSSYKKEQVSNNSSENKN